MSFLKSLFRPSKEEIWTQIADDIGGEFIDAGFWGTDVLMYKHKEWEIVLDTFIRSTGNTSIPYTRMQVPFVNKDGLLFQIYRANFFSSIGKFLGSQDIEIESPYFDDEFIIKGNDPYQIKRLLDDPKLKELFHNQANINIKIKEDKGVFFKQFPEGINVLYFECQGTMKKKNDLYNIFELFTAILDRLVAIDSAYEDDPYIYFVD